MFAMLALGANQDKTTAESTKERPKGKQQRRTKQQQSVIGAVCACFIEDLPGLHVPHELERRWMSLASNLGAKVQTVTEDWTYSDMNR